MDHPFLGLRCLAAAPAAHGKDSFRPDNRPLCVCACVLCPDDVLGALLTHSLTPGIHGRTAAGLVSVQQEVADGAPAVPQG